MIFLWNYYGILKKSMIFLEDFFGNSVRFLWDFFGVSMVVLWYIYDISIEFLWVFHAIFTSSTAQGGGGSFKNRKPIGEVGCCESGMAERSHWLTVRSLELCLLEWLRWLQWSPHPQLLDVVWCTATVVVVVA
jgi:hypothetical protein